MSENTILEWLTEEKEVKNKQNIVNTWDLLNQAKFDFIDEKLNENPNFFNIESTDFNESVYNGFFKYVNNNSKYNYLAFNDLAKYTTEQKTVLAKQLKSEIIKIKVPSDKNTQTLFDIFKNDYKFNDDVSENIFKEKIQKLSPLDVKKLLKKELERIKFINRLNVKWEKKESSILDKIDFEWIKTDDLTSEQNLALTKFNKSHNSLNSNEYLQLLSILTKNEREFLLEYLNTTFSLDELIKNNILSEKEAIWYTVENYRKIYPKLDIDELYEILNDNLDFNNIYVSSKELRYEHISKILKNSKLLEELFYNINEYKQEEQKAIQKDFYDNIDLYYKNDDKNTKPLIHNNFINFLNSDANKEKISINTLSTLNNFKKWNYLEINKNWKKYYYYISEIDEWWTKEWKHITIKNLTSEQNLNKVKSIKIAEENKMSYKELYYNLTGANINWDKISFINNEDFKTLDVKKADNEDDIKSESDLLEKLSSEKIINTEYSNLKITELALLDKTVSNKKLGDVSTYRTFRVDEATNSLIFDITGQKVSFSEFFEVLKDKKDSFKFEKKISTATEAFKNIKLSDNFKLDWDKLVYIDKKKRKKQIDYFLWKDWIALNIISISEWQVEYSYWKIKKSKDKKGKQTFEAKYSNKWFNDFVKDIWDDLKPDLSWIKLQEVDDEHSHKELKEKNWDVLWAWFSCLSISEVISAWNMYIDAFKNHLEMWNQFKASKLAEKFGVLAPQAVWLKLKTHTEAESKKLMEDLKWKVLTELNSTEAFKYIEENILENKHVEFYEVFAWMSFMLEKSWSLTAKGLLKYRWDYIWYQKLGWTVWDEFFMKEKAKFEESKFNNKQWWKPDPSFFTEEALIEAYLWKLSKEWKVFSRVDKDFWALRARWHERRFKKWLDDASTKYTVTSRIDYFMTHLSKWEDDRALWALWKILWKNKWDPAIMNKAPFVLAMWGFWKYYDGTNVWRLVWTAFETPYISVYFGIEQTLIDAYQWAIKQFFINKWEKSKADELDKILSKSTWDRVMLLWEFWDINWKELVDFINFKDWNILLQKGTDKDPNGHFQTFYDTVSAVFNDEEFEHTKWNYLKAWMYQESALASVKAKIWEAKDIRSDQSYGYWNEESWNLVKVYYARLIDIKNNSTLSREDKYKLFSDIYNPFEEKIRNSFWWYIKSIDFKNPEWDFPNDLHNYNLVLDYWDNKRKNRTEFLKHAFDYFMDNEIIKPNVIEDESEDNKEKVLDIMNYS